MKMYATTTSNKGKHAGKGSNDFLEICLEVEHDNKKREVFGTLFLRKEKDGRAIHAEECFVLDYEGEEIDRMVVEKDECEQTNCTSQKMVGLAWCEAHYRKRRLQEGEIDED